MSAPADRIYLVRHAKAEGSHPKGDLFRELTARGSAAFAAHARGLAPRLAVRRILSSPFVRAQQTARILGEIVGAPIQVEDDLASGRSPGRVLLLLARTWGAGVAVVGHNPEIGEAIALAGGHGSIVPGTVAAVDLDGPRPRLAFLALPSP